MDIKTKFEHCYFWPLMVGIAASAFSLPLARIAFGVCLLVWLIDIVRKSQCPRFPMVVVAWLAFLLVAFGASVFGLSPKSSLRELHKLVWFFVIPLTATLLNSRKRQVMALQVFSFGTAILGVRLLGRAWQAGANGIAAGMTDCSWSAFVSGLRRLPSPDNFWWALMDEGDLTDAQVLMVGIIISTGFLMLWKELRPRIRAAWASLWLLQAVTVFLQFKRGTWISLAVALLLLVLTTTRWSRRLGRPLVAAVSGRGKLVALVALMLLGALFAAPPVRRTVEAKYATLKQRAETAVPGRRLTMWLVVTPELARRYPWGVGWCATNEELLQSVYPALEARKTLHSNPAQILVGTGWLGLAVYIWWMAAALMDALRYAWRAAGRSRLQDIVASVLLWSLVALLANGLVECSLRKGNLVLILAVTMGAAAEGCRRLLLKASGRNSDQSPLPE